MHDKYHRVSRNFEIEKFVITACCIRKKQTLLITSQIAKFMGPTWRPHVSPMSLAIWDGFMMHFQHDNYSLGNTEQYSIFSYKLQCNWVSGCVWWKINWTQCMIDGSSCLGLFFEYIHQSRSQHIIGMYWIQWNISYTDLSRNYEGGLMTGDKGRGVYVFLNCEHLT